MDRLAEHCRRIGALGGSVRSEKKAHAARMNAKKPRPRKPKVDDRTEDTAALMLSQIAEFVSPFAEKDEDTTLKCVLRVLDEYYRLKAAEVQWYLEKKL